MIICTKYHSLISLHAQVNELKQKVLEQTPMKVHQSVSQDWGSNYRYFLIDWLVTWSLVVDLIEGRCQIEFFVCARPRFVTVPSKL